jgi:raffinose/stachyose/melibiose transport system permease protein
MNNMIAGKRMNRFNLLLEIILIIFMLVLIYPFILVFLNSFKTQQDMMLNFLDIPWKIKLTNYVDSWVKLGFFKAMLNSFYLTVGGVAGTVLISSIAAFKLARTNTKLSWWIFAICIAPMMVPFQTIMITLTQVTKTLGLSGSIWGLIIQYWGVCTPFTLFLYHGFVKAIPKELDESALVDGASPFRLFFQIIFPLLKPITTTAVVINSLYIWNDFILPLLMISGSKSTRNIQMALYSNFGSRGVNWELALPALIISAIPAIILFVVLQKYIIEGVAAGAVKG